jgi:formylglycine-generating enzyme required for sulfatase activity
MPNRPPEHIKSPFKFLDPYTRADRAIFFGRKEEAELLYQYVNKHRLVLVYGQSGTGKTSLVQCGLSNRFEVSDWLPFYIRRGEDINLSLRQEISKSKALMGDLIPEDKLLESLNLISARLLRPVYLIFDQFEELFILGKNNEEEVRKFIQTIDAILRSGETASVSLLFIMREEYFAYLDQFERAIPNFTANRLRVEPMGETRMEEVIVKTFAGFNIALEGGPETARQIIDMLRPREGISLPYLRLPYLQVYLDLLWREDLHRTYPAGVPEEIPWPPPLEFTGREIAEFGTIEDVLGRFLNERAAANQEELEKAFGAKGVEPKTVWEVLYCFATQEGTRQPVYFTRKGDETIPSEKAPPYLRGLPPSVLTACLKGLEDNRLIRSDENTFEIAHDSLAGKIAEKRQTEQGAFLQLLATVRTKFRNYLDGQEDFLNQRQLLEWDEVRKSALKYISEPERRPLEGFIQKCWAKRKEELEKWERWFEEKGELRSAAEKAERIATQRRRTVSFLALIVVVNAIGSLYLYFKKAEGDRKLDHYGITVLELLKEVDKQIKALDYPGALDKVKTAIATGKQPAEVERRLIEIMYVFNETGRQGWVAGLLDTFYTKVRKDSFTVQNLSSLEDIRIALRQLDSVWFDSLHTIRYYPEMVLVEGGMFLMGCDTDQGNRDCFDNEFPPHPVTLSDFRIARTETTVWQFNIYCTNIGLNIHDFAPAWGLSGDNPIVNANWSYGTQYARWLSNRFNVSPVFHLPTEAQWEYAARGGKKDVPSLYAGSDNLNEVGWYRENSGSQTHPVGTKKANELGLYDMSGNLWEWCQDWYGAYEETTGPDPKGAPTGEYRVLRGGSWFFNYRYCRVSDRLRNYPRDWYDGHGFRLSQDSE